MEPRSEAHEWAPLKLSALTFNTPLSFRLLSFLPCLPAKRDGCFGSGPLAIASIMTSRAYSTSRRVSTKSIYSHVAEWIVIILAAFAGASVYSVTPNETSLSPHWAKYQFPICQQENFLKLNPNSLWAYCTGRHYSFLFSLFFGGGYLY
jgi:hypothetical protein